MRDLELMCRIRGAMLGAVQGSNLGRAPVGVGDFLTNVNPAGNKQLLSFGLSPVSPRLVSRVIAGNEFKNETNAPVQQQFTGKADLSYSQTLRNGNPIAMKEGKSHPVTAAASFFGVNPDGTAAPASFSFPYSFETGDDQTHSEDRTFKWDMAISVSPRKRALASVVVQEVEYSIPFEAVIRLTGVVVFEIFQVTLAGNLPFGTIPLPFALVMSRLVEIDTRADMDPQANPGAAIADITVRGTLTGVLGLGTSVHVKEVDL